MFNKSDREQKKELRKYKNEDYGFDNDVGPVNDYNKLVNGVTYYCEPAWHLVIDDYDSGIGSIERSHRETDGYTRIVGYHYPENQKVSELDFTFAKPQDVIDVELDENIKKVKINSTNLRYINFEASHPVFVNIMIDTGTIDTLLGLRKFIDSNKAVIKDITLIDAGKVLDNALEKLLERPEPDVHKRSAK